MFRPFMGHPQGLYINTCTKIVNDLKSFDVLTLVLLLGKSDEVFHFTSSTSNLLYRSILKYIKFTILLLLKFHLASDSRL